MLNRALVAVLACCACRAQPSDETAAVVARSSGTACLDRGGAPPGNMDTYVVQLYEVEDATAIAPTAAECLRCIASPALCALEAESCRCGTPTPTSVEDLHKELTGTRLGGIDSGYAYCMRVIALERGDRADAGAESACACDPGWTAALFLAQRGRLCGVSAPRGAGPLPFQLDVRCPGDRRGDDSLFDDCVLGDR
jgi:hypothetical protein